MTTEHKLAPNTATPLLPLERPEFSDTEKMACLLREIHYRLRVYTRMVQQGKMKQDKADYEIEVIRAIAQDYQNKINEQADGRK
jgi:hypothetical protein